MAAVKLFANTVIFREEALLQTQYKNILRPKSTLDFTKGSCILAIIINQLRVFNSMKGKTFYQLRDNNNNKKGITVSRHCLPSISQNIHVEVG